MCVTNIYTDVDPNGEEVKFRQFCPCEFSLDDQPCSSHTEEEYGGLPPYLQFDATNSAQLFSSRSRTQGKKSSEEDDNKTSAVSSTGAIHGDNTNFSLFDKSKRRSISAKSKAMLDIPNVKMESDSEKKRRREREREARKHKIVWEDYQPKPSPGPPQPYFRIEPTIPHQKDKIVYVDEYESSPRVVAWKRLLSRTPPTLDQVSNEARLASQHHINPSPKNPNLEITSPQLPVQSPPSVAYESAMPPTDSGYASMGHPKNLNSSGKDQNSLLPSQESVTEFTGPSKSNCLSIDDGDNQTILTTNENLYLPNESKEILITAFVYQLYHDIGPLPKDLDDYLTISDSLSSLLKDFSVKIYHAAVENMQREAVSFVRQNRNYISTEFKNVIELHRLSQIEAMAIDVNSKSPDQIPLSEKMAVWDMEDAEPPQEEIIEEGDGYYDNDDLLSSFSKHQDFLQASIEYRWLVGKMRAMVDLHQQERHIMSEINKEINSGFDRMKHKRIQSSAPEYTVLFDCSIKIVTFLDSYYGKDPCRDIGSVVTLTGSASGAQAVTCKQYLTQTWPISGNDTLGVLERALATRSSELYKCTLMDGTQFECKIDDETLLLYVTGTRPSLVEISEQLAWLTAALQWSPNSDKMAASSAHALVTVLPENLVTNISIILDSTITVLGDEDPGPESNGCCWHLLFQNPVIVKGFPIPNRLNNEQGLEIPMDLMAAAGDASFLTDFNKVPVLKGFSTMFVATEVNDNSINWHFFCNESGGRISYLNALDCHFSKPKEYVAETYTSAATRNFVGWVSSVKRLAGTQEYNYSNLDWSRANYSSAGCALQKVSLNAGQFITTGITIGSGLRNKRIFHSPERSYVEAINYARRNIYINFYDLGDRRGWLLDGASAVLHITRTQLSHHESPHSDDQGHVLKAFHHPQSDAGVNAAVSALKNEANKILEITVDPPEIVIEETTKDDGTTSKVVKKTSKKTLFHNLVTRNLKVFELMHDYQKWLMEAEGINLRGTDREKLEGWEFLDIVSCESSLKPRVQTLLPSSRGWVDFTREIHTVNILGRGFGRLLEPGTGAGTLCDGWKQVPREKDLLSTCVSTISDIQNKYGSYEGQNLQLAKNIYWHKTHLLFESCECIPGRTTCIRAQDLLPQISIRKGRPEPYKEAGGAVIFGRGNIFGSSFLNPSYPIPESDLSGIGASFQSSSDPIPEFDLSGIPSDSGLGTSISTLPTTKLEASLSGLSSPSSAAHDGNSHVGLAEEVTISGPDVSSSESLQVPTTQSISQEINSASSSSTSSKTHIKTRRFGGWLESMKSPKRNTGKARAVSPSPESSSPVVINGSPGR